jgi:maleylpyruvate isomerase
VSLADVFLIPQLVNARRFKVDLRWPRLLEVEAACLQLQAFRQAAPEHQPDFERE